VFVRVSGVSLTKPSFYFLPICSAKNSLSPAWTTTFQTTYTFGKETKFNVGIFDEVRKENKAKTMGSALFEIGEVLGARGSIKAKKLKNGGTVFARVTKAAEVQQGTFHGQLRGIKLKNVDGLFSKSDPFFIVNSQSNDPGGRVWQPVYRSEVIQNNLNPTWKEFSISIEKLCGGERDRAIQIEVFDWEKSGKHQAMGKFQTSVNGMISSVVMGGTGDPKTVPMTGALKLIHKGKSFGNLVVIKGTATGENLRPVQPASAAGLPNFGSAPGNPPPSRVNINGVIRLNPDYTKWKQAQGQQTSAPAVDGTAAPVPARTSVSSIPPLMPPPPFNPDYTKWKQAQGQQTSAPAAYGTAAAVPARASVSSVPSHIAPSPQSFPPGTQPKFVDYISGGTEISLAVAVDFTGSNGDPRKPGTLHYLRPDGQLNDYEKALTAVGSIVARYDSDQMFPVLGFGAKYGGVIHHCFQVGKAPELSRVGGMVEGYREVFKTGLTMSGPTVFADVIQHVAAQAQSEEEANRAIGKQSYTILLILTDGAVTDIEQTKTAIRYASTAPLSIVIVGIGDADFSRMQFLDDFQRDEGGRTRDIVQFVEFGRHQHNRQALTRETLDEIPDQLVNYFYGNGTMPLPPVSGSKLSIFEEDYDKNEDVDLDMDINADGEINLSDPTQATWDAQSYGNAASFLPHPSAPPAMRQSYAPGVPTSASAQSGPYAPSGPGGSYISGAPSLGGSYISGAPSPGGGAIYGAPSPGGSYTTGAPSPSPHGSYISGAPSPYGGGRPAGAGSTNPSLYGGGRPTNSYVPQGIPAAAHPTTTVRIQAPANSYPGMQLQVQNPATGQFQIVTVPQGVAPGSAFAVPL
jgi:hypothetical protein